LAINALLDVDDMDHVWSLNLKGKLELKGIIDAAEIEKAFYSISMQTARTRMATSPSDSFGAAALPPSLPVVAAKNVVMQLENGGASVSASASMMQIGNTAAAASTDSATGASALLMLTSDATHAHNIKGRTGEREANQLLAGRIKLHRVSENMYRADDSVVVFGAGAGASIGGDFSSADLRVLAMYVRSMKTRVLVMKQMRVVASTLPGISVGGNHVGGNKAKAAHLLTQLGRFFEHYGGGVASFEPG
jgi:hypothetical protein